MDSSRTSHFIPKFVSLLFSNFIISKLSSLSIPSDHHSQHETKRHCCENCNKVTKNSCPNSWPCSLSAAAPFEPSFMLAQCFGMLNSIYVWTAVVLHSMPSSQGFFGHMYMSEGKSSAGLRRDSFVLCTSAALHILWSRYNPVPCTSLSAHSLECEPSSSKFLIFG